MLNTLARMLGKKTLYSEIVEILSSELAAYLSLQACLQIVETGDRKLFGSINMSGADPTVQKLAKKLASAWLTTLPNEVLKNCSAGMISTYIFVAEA